MGAKWVGLPLGLELVGGLRKAIWRTARGLTFLSKHGLCNVPARWVTDLTSIPWWLVWKRREGDHTPASVIHDWCYAKGYVIGGFDDKVPITRKQADRIYLAAMLSLGVRPRVAKLIYRGVRLGGLLVWRRYRRRDSG